MKSIIVRFLAGVILAGFAVSSAYAGEVVLAGVTIAHQTAQAELFIVKFVVINNSNKTLTGARAYADRVYCEKARQAREACSADTPSIASGGSHTVTLLVLPGDEAYLRLSLRQDRNAEPYAEVTIPRAKYDSKGAAIYGCRNVKKLAAPATKVPKDKMKMVAPKP
ncbi:MAG TPA: hypothetical protein ENN61_04500 [Bacteroidaceae bacterium]|nr:hypothetical protein [Bacteroidaceae bacterium]